MSYLFPEFDTKTIEKYENDKTDLIPFSYILKYNRDEDVNELETNKNRNYESVLKVNGKSISTVALKLAL